MHPMIEKTQNKAMKLLVGLPLVLTLLGSAITRANDTNRSRIVPDISYARVGDRILKLDLHVPDRKPRSPLIVWVHGGAWRSGSKKDMPLRRLVVDGYAVASVDYRLST